MFSLIKGLHIIPHVQDKLIEGIFTLLTGPAARIRDARCAYPITCSVLNVDLVVSELISRTSAEAKAEVCVLATRKGGEHTRATKPFVLS